MLNEAADTPEPDDLLTEPDLPDEEEEEQEEVSAISTGGASLQSTGAIRGVTTPLGAGPEYPNKSKKVSKRKSPAQAAGDSFGGARPLKKSK